MFRFPSARRFGRFLEPALASLFLYSCPTAARAAAGTAGATFLDIPVGAEPASLGSAYSALASNAYAPSWNPGGLGFVTSPQAAAQYLSYLQSINYEYASLAYPLSPGKSLGAAVQYLGTGDIAGAEVGGAPAGNFSSYYAAYALAYGQKVTDRLSLGMSGKWINAQISDVSASAFAADFGGLYKVREDVTLAATLDNLGTRLKFLDTGDPLPLAFHAAAAYQPSRRWLATLEGV